MEWFNSLFAEIFTSEGLVALGQVIMIDLVLAADNAVVIGMAAAGLPKEMRTKAIALGIAAATLMRIGFALITSQLMAMVGLLLLGGVLLLWVCWKMWRELRENHSAEDAGLEAVSGEDLNEDGRIAKGAPRKTFAQAAWQIVIADVSMSLDNVLAVAGAAREHPGILIVGLALSIAMMAFAASFVAKLLAKYRWIGYVGFAIIFYVALKMCYDGALQIWPNLLG
jgi:YjbE family integral membrane protein